MFISISSHIKSNLLDAGSLVLREKKERGRGLGDEGAFGLERGKKMMHLPLHGPKGREATTKILCYAREVCFVEVEVEVEVG